MDGWRVPTSVRQVFHLAWSVVCRLPPPDRLSGAAPPGVSLVKHRTLERCKQRRRLAVVAIRGENNE